MQISFLDDVKKTAFLKKNFCLIKEEPETKLVFIIYNCYRVSKYNFMEKVEKQFVDTHKLVNTKRTKQSDSKLYYYAW